MAGTGSQNERNPGSVSRGDSRDVPDGATSSLLDEIRRRSVIREVLAYIAAAALLIELADIVTEAFGGPAWILRGTIVLVTIGFIPALAVSWLYEISPGRVRRDGASPKDSRRLRNRRLTIVTGAMLAVFAGLYFFMPEITSEPEAQTPQGKPELVLEERAAPRIAVLPLEMVQVDEDTELMAYGIVEDLHSQLAKIPSLRVISHHATQEYQNTSKGPAEIGAELLVQALLQGSIQVVADRLRLRVQLLSSESGEQLWAETYDRRLNPASLFQIQSEIARAIAGALSATLTDEDQAQLDLFPTENMAAYRAYHRARRAYYEITRAGETREDDYLAALDEAVALDPRFVQAWAERVHACAWGNQQQKSAERSACVDEGLQVLQDIAPESGEYRMAQASYLYYGLKDYEQGMTAIEQAIERQPDQLRFHELKYYIARRMGSLDLQRETARDAMALDPQNEMWVGTYAWLLEDPRDQLKVYAHIPRGRSYEIDFGRLSAEMDVTDLGPQEHLEKVEQLSSIYQDRPLPHHLWYTQMMAKDYAGALQSVDAIRAIDLGHELHPLDAATVHGLITYHYSGKLDALAAALEEADRVMAEYQPSPDETAIDRGALALAGALVSALRGEDLAAEALVREWELIALANPVVLTIAPFRAMACFILGISKSEEGVLNCLEAAGSERGFVDNAKVVRHWPGFAFLQGHPEYEELLDGFNY